MQNITIYNKEESITFNGKYSNQNRILATISITPFEFMNFKWNSVEHLYRYLKYYNNLEAKKFIIRTPNPLHIKEISNYLQYELKTYNQIPEFDKNRHNIILLGNILKTLQNPLVKEFLLSTEQNNIIELTEWIKNSNDTFFGCVSDMNKFIGRNVHGKCWMKIRSALLNNTLQNLLKNTITILQQDNILPPTC